MLLLLALAGTTSAFAGPPNPTPSDANHNTAAGTNALLKVTSGLHNTAIGFAALYKNRTGRFNTASGSTALINNTTGEYNTAIGGEALHDNTTGFFNTANGSGALRSNTTGSSNTATGVGALVNNTTGNGNTASGSSTLVSNTTGSTNTASGFDALYFNTTGSNNTASGVNALYNNTTGFFNTAGGAGALYANGSGSRNIALGYRAGRALVSGSDNIYIGNPGGAANEGATIRIGAVQARAFVAGIRGTTTGRADAVAVYIDSKGQLGTVNSSARFKEDISDMAGYSRALFDLRPVTYRYKEPAADGSRRPLEPGLVAEEVAEIYPDLVVRGADGEIETVQYHKLTPMLLNELQNQHRMLDAEAARNTVLEEKVTALEASLDEARAEARLLRAVLAAQNERLARLETASLSVSFKVEP